MGSVVFYAELFRVNYPAPIILFSVLGKSKFMISWGQSKNSVPQSFTLVLDQAHRATHQ